MACLADVSWVAPQELYLPALVIHKFFVKYAHNDAVGHSALPQNVAETCAIEHTFRPSSYQVCFSRQ